MAWIRESYNIISRLPGLDSGVVQGVLQVTGQHHLPTATVQCALKVVVTRICKLQLPNCQIKGTLPGCVGETCDSMAVCYQWTPYKLLFSFKANCEREQRVQPLVAHQHSILADADDSKAGVPAEIFLVEVFRFNYAKLNCSEWRKPCMSLIHVVYYDLICCVAVSTVSEKKTQPGKYPPPQYSHSRPRTSSTGPEN